MSSLDAAVLGLLAGLSITHGTRSQSELDETLRRSGLAPSEIAAALESVLNEGWVKHEGAMLRITETGSLHLLEACARIEVALDNSPVRPHQEACPSLPWLTAVQTEWVDAVSINYAVDPQALKRLLPEPLEPEIHRDRAWVQVLLSSLRDLRPQGLPALFGVNFYQVSYRAAVWFPDQEGRARRGGYFIRSETNHAVMRAVGNALAEFRFHDFGAAQMVMLRNGRSLILGVEAERPGGQLFARFETPGTDQPPARSCWTSLRDLQEPLVECYDAFGVDRETRRLYTLTIDRGPWNARFVEPESLYCEVMDEGMLGGGAATYDSTLHIARCAYRWRPLRRESF